MWGGRGGSKSWSVARALLRNGVQSRLRVLCTREFQNSIRESVHQVLTDQIATLNLDSHYTIGVQEITGKNGTEFVFAGLRTHPQKIKSYEGVDVCWVEQAEQVDKDSWINLIPTIRKDGSEIWATLNPDEETDPVYQMFVAPTLPGGDPTKLPPNSLVININWQDNPWFPRVLMDAMLYLRSVDPDSCDHVYGGHPKKHSKARVLSGKYVSYSFEPIPGVWDGPYQGLDFGFSTTPAAAVRCWVHDNRLWIEHESFGLGLEIDESEQGLLRRLERDIPDFARHTTKADNARPESISYMQRHGFERVTACAKWRGSVEDGISHLRSYQEIVIHPRCVNALDQAKLWQYKVDRLTGEPMADLQDGNDDVYDATRYSLEKIIRPGKSFFDGVVRR